MDKSAVSAHAWRSHTSRFSAISLALTIALIACNTTPKTTDSNTNRKPWKSSNTNAAAVNTGYLSDQDWTSATSTWGPISKNQAYGEGNPADRKKITLSSTQYEKGLGTHADSSVTFKLDPSCSSFKASIGIDDQVRWQTEHGNVLFQVYGENNKLLFDSKRVDGSTPTKDIDVNVSGQASLKLVVDQNKTTTEGDQSDWYDQADWANARVECAGSSTPPTNPQPPTPPTSVLSTGFVSDQMDLAFNQQNGWGPIEINMANGDDVAQKTPESPYYNGHEPPLTLKTGVVAKGLGVHASSSVEFPLGGQCSSFNAVVGLDQAYLDQLGHTVNFQVLVDGVVKRESGVLNEDSSPVKLEVDITGGKTLKLVVTDGGDGNSYDHADWTDAKVVCGTVSNPPAPTPPSPTPTPPSPPTGPVTGAYVDSSGTIVVNGNKFFPFGFYGVNWRQPFSERMKGLQNIGDSGFNTMLAEDIATNEFGSLLDEAARLNVKMLIGFPSFSGNEGRESIPYIVETVNKYKSKAAVLGWSMFDDSDDGRLTYNSLRELNDVAKSNDPAHITFSTLTGYYTERRTNKSQWLAGSDASGLQMYSIAPPNDYSFNYSSDKNGLTESFNVSRDYVVAAEQAQKAMIINSQTFSWGPQSSNSRYPTKAELRNMIFGQIIAGAKGIVGFVYSQELFDQKELWNELVAIKDDALTTLSGPILNGALTRKTTADIDLNYSYWEYQGACYVGILNTSYTDSKQVNISLPSQCAGGISSPVLRLPNTMQLNGSNLSGTIGATEVEIYRVGGN